MNALKQNVGKWIAALLLVLAGQGACAATATIDGFDSSKFVETVQGTWVHNTEVHFDEPGAYKLTLTNFQFPQALDAVGVMVSTATDSIVSLVSYDKPELLSKLFNVNQGAYYLSIFAISDRALNIGTLGVSFESATTEVPVPPALVLLMSGIMSLVAFARRKQTA